MSPEFPLTKSLMGLGEVHWASLGRSNAQRWIESQSIISQDSLGWLCSGPQLIAKEEPGRNWAEEPWPHPPGQRFGTWLLSFKNESEPEDPLNRNSGSMVGGGGQRGLSLSWTPSRGQALCGCSTSIILLLLAVTLQVMGSYEYIIVKVVATGCCVTWRLGQELSAVWC